jgi:hypothetical protein
LIKADADPHIPNKEGSPPPLVHILTCASCVCECVCACTESNSDIDALAHDSAGKTSLQLVEEKSPQLKTFFDKNTNALRGTFDESVRCTAHES